MKESHGYETEFSTNEILKNMLRNTYNNFNTYDSSSINENYLNLRNSIFDIMQKITMQFRFKSQTFFLTTYYLDIIFMKKKKININLNKLGLACLCLSSKFCENDPYVPQLQYFVKAYNSITGYKNFISMTELMHTEVAICKILKYKLNYFTTYDFIAFFFCHGIFKFEQIKEIQIILNNNVKKSEKNNKEFELDTFFVKNILGKIYKIVRNYLDKVIKIENICMKYNPLYIAIYLIENSMKECLENEYKKSKGNLNNDDFIKEINNFNNRNSKYYQEIMNEFYKIHYEDNEKYKQLIIDDEINSIFNKEKKTNTKPKNNDDIDSKKNKLFNNTMTSGFFKRLKLPLNHDNDNKEKYVINKEENSISTTINKLNKENIENNINQDSNNIEHEDDLDKNLNINELKRTMNSKNKPNSENKKFQKISMKKINSFDLKENNKGIELKAGKIKHFNTKVDSIRNNDDTLKISSSYKTLETGKKPYLKKLINGNNRNIVKSFNQSLKASTSTNFYSSKLKNLNKTENNLEPNKSTNFLKINNNTTKNNPRIINTAITKKYKKIVNNNELSSKSLRSKKIFKEKFDNKTLSSTGENFYTSQHFNKISVNKLKGPKNTEIKNSNINKEFRTKKISYNIYNDNSRIFTSAKDLNKTVGKIYIKEHKDDIKISRNNENNESTNDKSTGYKKIGYNKIHNNHIQTQTNKKIDSKKITFKKKPNDNSIKEGYSMKNINNINNNSATTKQFKTINKENSSTKIDNTKSNNQPSVSSFYNIFQRAKTLFNKDKGVNEIKKVDKKIINSYKKEEQTKSLYTSQKNFYKKNHKINDNNKEKEQKSSNTIIINNNININIGNKKDLKIPELNINNTIVTSGPKSINLRNKFNTQNIKNNDGSNNQTNKKAITFKNIFHKFHFNKK